MEDIPSIPETHATSGDSSDEDGAVQEVKRIAGDDTNKIRLSKVLVLLIISAAGAIVSIGINRYLKDQEHDDVKHSVSAILCHLNYIIMSVSLSSIGTCWLHSLNYSEIQSRMYRGFTFVASLMLGEPCRVPSRQKPHA